MTLGTWLRRRSVSAELLTGRGGFTRCRVRTCLLARRVWPLSLGGLVQLALRLRRCAWLTGHPQRPGGGGQLRRRHAEAGPATREQQERSSMAGSPGTGCPDLPGGAGGPGHRHHQLPGIRVSSAAAPAYDADDEAEVLGDQTSVPSPYPADRRRRAAASARDHVPWLYRGVGDVVVVPVVPRRADRAAGFTSPPPTPQDQLASTGIPSARLLDQLDDCGPAVRSSS